jgi:predicted NAD/FAD-dependent oxidoreductase
MSALAKHLAEGLDVRCNSLVFAVRPGEGRWDVGLDDGTSVTADALIVTCPLPQSYAILVSAGIELPAELRQTEYDRTISLLAALDGPAAVPPPGGRQNPDDVFSFVADNVARGTSDTPALTLHANPAWSDANWDRDAASLTAELLGHAEPWIGGAGILESSLKKWRFATPRVIWPEACWRTDSGPAPVLLAGDAFAGPRVEGAALSGLAAAASLLTPAQ